MRVSVDTEAVSLSLGYQGGNAPRHPEFLSQPCPSIMGPWVSHTVASFWFPFQ